MTIQLQLRTATDRIIAARQELADREFERMAFARNARNAKTTLDTATATLMARSQAGTNDTARRAYAIYETATERQAVKASDERLTEAEAAVLDATTQLRIAEDERRYLELVAQLAIAGASDIDGQRDEDEATYNRTVAEALVGYAASER